MGKVFALRVETDDVTCCSCNMLFSVPLPWLEGRRKSHTTFWCPNGHSLCFPDPNAPKQPPPPPATYSGRVYDCELCCRGIVPRDPWVSVAGLLGKYGLVHPTCSEKARVFEAEWKGRRWGFKRARRGFFKALNETGPPPARP